MSIFDLTNPASFAKSIGATILNYSYRVKVSPVTVTGEPDEAQHITIISNDLLTEEQIHDTARSYWESGNYGEGLSIGNLEITDAMRSKALGD